MRIKILTVFLMLIAGIFSTRYCYALTGTNPGFIENKGQIHDQNNNPNPAVLYLLNIPGMNVQLRKDGFSYDVYKDNYETNPHPLPSWIRENPMDSLIAFYRFHRIDFNFIGSNSDCRVKASGPSAGYLNYYTTGTPQGGATNVHHFNQVTYENIYPGIDLEFLADEKEGFKYNIIVRQGGNICNVRMKISDPAVTLTPSGTLILKNSLYSIEEMIPSSFFTLNQHKTDANVKFITVKENIYGVRVSSKIPVKATLTIDPLPRRLWCTYYGGNAREWIGNCILSQGGVIFFGQTMSANNIATAGAYQSSFAGFTDGYIARFTTDGQRVWGTYYGGEDTDLGELGTADSSGYLYYTGSTLSHTGIATAGAFQTQLLGTRNGFLAKFTSSGFLIWGTYFGSNMISSGVCVVNKFNDVFVVGGTDTSYVLATAGAIQPAYGGGLGDAFIASFDSSGHRRWGTFYGGNAGDGAESIAVDVNGNVYFGGETESLNNISSSGSFQPVNGGGSDGFLVKLDRDGQRFWGTYYGGTGGEGIWGISITADNKLYISGYTNSPNNIATAGTYQPVIGGDYDAFLAKFTTDGQRLWGTYFGGPGQDMGCSDAVSDSQYVFVIGATKSLTGIATANAYQTTFAGGYRDGFIAKFDSAGQRVWSTYYGGSSDDIINMCTADSDYNIYFAGSTNSDDGIATPGAFQANRGGDWDNYYGKLRVCLNPEATSVSGSSDVCKNSTGINYSVTPFNYAQNYYWQVPPGMTIVSGQNTTSILVNVSGSAISGDIYAWATNYCGIGDTAFLHVSVHPRPVPVITGTDTLCTGTQITYSTASGQSQYSWTFSSGGMKTSGGGTGDSTITILWNGSGVQFVRVNYTNQEGCQALNPTNKNVLVNPISPVTITVNASVNPVCQGSPVVFTAVAGYGGSSPSYQWKVNSVNAGTNNSVFTYTPVNGDVVTCTLTSSAVCVSDNPATSLPVVMTVNEVLPVSVSITASENPVCGGLPVTFNATPVNSGTSPVYQWKVNLVNAGTNNNLYTYIPLNGDVVTCVLTSSEMCSSGNPATSNTIIMTVVPGPPAGVSISAVPNPFCSGSLVNCQAVPTNGGLTPSYQWKVNGINAGTNASTYSFVPLQGNIVQCVMNSSLSCITNNPVTSNSLVMNALASPSVSFTLCFDSITTINAAAFKLKGGVPIGGVYSGPGVNSGTGIFTPSIAGVGTKTITYSYTNVSSCTAIMTRNIIVQTTPSFNCGQNLTDIRDNKIYPTIQIGTQCWMQKNLNYGISLQGSKEQTDNCINEKYCYSDNAANCTLYGGLYQWDELMAYSNTPGSQGLCPPGWHIPTQTEWNTLFTFYQEQSLAGKPLQDSIFNGFRAKESGIVYSNISWKFQGFATLYWTSNPYGAIKALSHGMNLQNFSVSDYYSNRSNAFAVRCLRN